MKRTVSGLFLTTLALAWLASAPSAAAQEGKPSLLILYADSDQLSDGEKDALLEEQKLFAGKYNKYSLPETPKVDFLDEMVNFECLEMDAGCLVQIVAKENVDFVLYTAFDGSKVRMRLVDVKAKSEVKAHEAAANKGSIKKVGGEKAFVALIGPVPKPPKKQELVLVKIDANVEKADVFVDQKRVGSTPLELKLKEGDYTVAVRKPEFLMVEEKVKVAGKEITWKATLKPVPKKVVTPVKPVKPVKPGDKKEEKKDDEVKPFYATWWFWTIVGAAVVTTATVTAVAVSDTGDSFDVGTVKFTINSSAAEKDFIFYE